MTDFNCEFTDEEQKFSDEMINELKNALKTATIEVLKPQYSVFVNITVVSSEEIRRLNRETRNTDRVTDVLSYPMFFFSSPTVFSKKPEIWDFNPEDNSLFMGDIVLCMEKIREQSEAYGHSFLRESVYLTVHGMLHLFGYDHMEDEDKRIMREKEKEIMSILKIER